ncbi:VCBS repeat-containing protein [Actinoplanes sp. NPDC051411]|uniref:FG-GAP repeat domain-containing protein n=1 Tax=Actinoplanes sp. NPDC051411 TaxID=3155522 RepID=UPI003449CA2B
MRKQLIRIAALPSAVVLAVTAGGAQAIARVDTRLATTPAAASLFADPVQYPAAARFWSLVDVDLNGDGKVDIATGNGNNTISVFLNKGDGTFLPRTDYVAQSLPYFLTFDVVAADFTGDGKPDLAISGGNPVGYVQLFANKGDGTLAAPVVTPMGFGPNQLVATDLNHDGKSDLITTNNFAADVSVRLGNGNGTFKPEHKYEVGPGPQGLEIADANRDHIPDILTGNFGRPKDSLSVAYGRGDGTFGKTHEYNVAVSGNDVAVGDFNRDGILDAAVPEFVTNKIQVVLGRRAGGFGPPVTYDGSTGVNEATAADLNGDGKLDLIDSVSPDQNRDPGSPPPPPGLQGAGIAVLLGHGDGRFAERTIFPIEGAIAAILPIDVDGDGRLDVAAADLNTNTLVVWHNTSASH